MKIQVNRTPNWDSVAIDEIGAATVDDLKDLWAYNMDSNLSGVNGTDFAITDSGSGQIDIAAGKLFIRTTDSVTGNIVSYDYPGETNISVTTDPGTNWVYIDYNGGSPAAATTASISSINLNTQVVVGRVYRNGNDITVWNVGQYFSNYRTNDYKKDFEIYGAQRASGLVLEETGTRNVTVTAGVFYCSHNRVTTSAIDTSGADTFDEWNSSASTSADSTGETQIDNTQYWNGAALATLGNNRYGTRFMYVDLEGNLHMQFGESNSNQLGGALAEPVPTPPAFLRDFAIYIGRIVILKNDSVFTAITNPFESEEQGAIVTEHDDLGTLTFTDSGHTGTADTLAGFDGSGVATEYTESDYFLKDGSRAMTGTLDMGENDIDNVGDIIHDDAPASDWILKNEDADKDIIFGVSDGGVYTETLRLYGDKAGAGYTAIFSGSTGGTNVLNDGGGFVFRREGGGVSSQGQCFSDNVNNAAGFNFVRALGTIASPAAVTSGTVLNYIRVYPYYDGSTTGLQAQFQAEATENHSATNRGTAWSFSGTPTGSATMAEWIRLIDSNIKIGGTATRATTEGTKHLDIFDGTAPVGTLANGVSLYSTSGELRVMDAAGNSTILSPHSKEDNSWIFDSIDTTTGKHLRIDMEKMLKYLNDKFGTDFVHEFIEEGYA